MMSSYHCWQARRPPSASRAGGLRSCPSRWSASPSALGISCSPTIRASRPARIRWILVVFTTGEQRIWPCSKSSLHASACFSRPAQPCVPRCTLVVCGFDGPLWFSSLEPQRMSAAHMQTSTTVQGHEEGVTLGGALQEVRKIIGVPTFLIIILQVMNAIHTNRPGLLSKTPKTFRECETSRLSCTHTNDLGPCKHCPAYQPSSCGCS